jgi:hypothetical protein
MTLFRKLAAAAFLMFASTTAANAQTEVDEWTIFTNPNNCRAISTFAKGTTVSIAIYADGRATMMFLDDNVFGSVRNNAPVDGQLAFVQGESLETKWSTLTLTGVILDDGKGKKGAMLQTPSGGDFLATVSKSEIFGLLRGDEVLASIKPTNPGALVKGLRTCASNL